MLPGLHLGCGRTEQDPQSKAHAAACLVSPSRAEHVDPYVSWEENRLEMSIDRGYYESPHT